MTIDVPSQRSRRRRPLGHGPFRDTVVVTDKSELSRVIRGITRSSPRRSKAQPTKRSRSSVEGRNTGRPVNPHSLRSFAKRSGISQSTLSRLRSGACQWIQRCTYDRLRQHAGRWGPVLEGCFGADAAGVILDQAAKWYRDELDSACGRLGLTLGERERLKRVYKESARLERAVGRLEDALKECDSPTGRRLAAYCSAIGPLNRFFVTSGLERGLGELSDSELANFVAWGLDRESVLLRRARDVVRSQWMSALDERVDELEGKRETDLGRTDAMCSWDFRRAEKIYANTNLEDDSAD